MVRTIKELRAMPDDELIAEHDAHARHTSVGTSYYMEELDRRSRDRSTEVANRLARISIWLFGGSILLSAIAAAAAVLALLR
ncbi:hypothetical protein [Microbacterium algeriense]|uniref:hypothetical protein n=1 Tax=Microbacterium algeriense TaxID=2615184 RepID=UPI003D713A6F